MEAALQLLASTGAPKPPPAEAAPAAAKEPPPAEGAPAEKPPQTSRAKEFALQARKERALLDQQRAIKAEADRVKAAQAEIEKTKADLDARMKAVGETEAQRKARRTEYLKNPRLVLEDAGLTLEQLAEAVMRDGAPDPALVAQSIEERLQEVSASVDERLGKLAEAERQRDEKAAEAAREAARQEQEEAVAQVRSELAETAKAEPDRFELVNFYGKDAHDLAYRAIETHYQDTGEVLPYASALEKVEAFLEKRVEELGKTKKVGARMRSPEKPAAPAAAPAAAPTLGNVAAAPTSPTRKLTTTEERMAAAEAALRAAKF